MNYRIEMPKNRHEAEVLQDTLAWLEAQDEMREDYEKLARVCCSVEVPVTISRAPTPKTFAEANITFQSSEKNYQAKEELETFLL